ncbi:ferredoxin reductase family protein [Spiribacter halobius]|nr:ferredoxin reductase family protein [Spiribacter halobius]UEX79281.1 ferredoxin reductase family protein [Spiribacter halobius]
MSASRAALWPLAYLAAILLPLALALLAGRPGRPFAVELSAAVGMAGFSLLLLEFVLSGRYQRISADVGMDAVMRFHQAMAWVLLVLLLIHPYLYALFPRPTGLVDGLPAAPPADSAVGGASGMVAWILLAALITLSAVRDDLPVRYETWRLSHGFGALLVAVLAAAHTILSGHHAAAPALAGFWIVATALAALTLLRAYVLKPLLLRRRPWRIRDVRALAPGIHELRLTPDGHAGLPYQAGQFVWLRFQDRLPGLTEHPFSLASSPAEGPELRFLIKANGDFTGGIGDLPEGRRALVDGPYGRFGAALEDSEASGFLLIAGGVGLAPMLGLLHTLAAAGETRPVRLVVANADAREIVLDKELQGLAERLDLRVTRVVDDPDRPDGALPGPVDTALLAECLTGAERARWQAFVCAPPGMIDAVEGMLEALGLPASRVHAERFRYRYGLASPSARRNLRLQAVVLALVLAAVAAFALAVG